MLFQWHLLSTKLQTQKSVFLVINSQMSDVCFDENRADIFGDCAHSIIQLKLFMWKWEKKKQATHLQTSAVNSSTTVTEDAVWHLMCFSCQFWHSKTFLKAEYPSKGSTVDIYFMVMSLCVEDNKVCCFCCWCVTEIWSKISFNKSKRVCLIRQSGAGVWECRRQQERRDTHKHAHCACLFS